MKSQANTKEPQATEMSQLLNPFGCFCAVLICCLCFFSNREVGVLVLPDGVLQINELIVNKQLKSCAMPL